MKDLQLLLFFFCVQREILCLLLLACLLAEVLQGFKLLLLLTTSRVSSNTVASFAESSILIRSLDLKQITFCISGPTRNNKGVRQGFAALRRLVCMSRAGKKMLNTSICCCVFSLQSSLHDDQCKNSINLYTIYKFCFVICMIVGFLAHKLCPPLH